ncbi:MAG: RNA polymerase sigma factor [Planctomycetes bacterium]|nr:RNA polymerase sigma factor [Planctomycetota bacterium]
MKEDPPHDIEICERLANNDSSILEVIWDMYASDLLVFLIGILRQRHEAEDVLQEVFVGIAEKRSVVAKAEKLKPYLFRMAKNKALNRLAKMKRRKEWSNQGLWLTEMPENKEQKEVAENGVNEEIQYALSVLPEKQREVLVLKFFRKKKFQEISEILNVSISTIASRYRYGCAKIKNLLKSAEL